MSEDITESTMVKLNKCYNVEATSSNFEVSLTIKPGSFPHYPGDHSQVNLFLLAEFPHLYNEVPMGQVLVLAPLDSCEE